MLSILASVDGHQPTPATSPSAFFSFVIAPHCMRAATMCTYVRLTYDATDRQAIFPTVQSCKTVFECEPPVDFVIAYNSSDSWSTCCHSTALRFLCCVYFRNSENQESHDNMAETHHMRTAEQLPKSSTFATWNKEAEELAKACKCAEMPSMEHLTSSDYDNVYEPADDTYLLLDGLGVEFDDGAPCTGDTAPSVLLDANDIEMTPTIDHPADRVAITLELGCGTGAVTTYLAKVLYDRRRRILQKESLEGGNGNDIRCPSSAMHYVTDVNPHAVSVALRTAEASNLPRGTIEPILCDLASPLLDKLSGKVDVLIFNPPYVPTPDDEVGSAGIEASWAGGKDGRIVLDRALPQIARLLSRPHGAAYVITVDDNLPEDIAEKMRLFGVNVKPLLVRRKARNEYLSVQKFTLMIECGERSQETD